MMSTAKMLTCIDDQQREFCQHPAEVVRRGHVGTTYDLSIHNLLLCWEDVQHTHQWAKGLSQARRKRWIGRVKGESPG